MALVLKDRVKETTTTVGTGSLTLLGAVVGYQAFSVIGNGNTCYYAISSPTGNEWEVGIGTYTSSGTSLSRDTILSSSSSGSVVNLSAGTKDVYVVYPAEKAVYEDSSNKVVQSDFVNLDVSGTATLATATITAGTVSTTPASATDIANKQYVDTLVSSGITYHQPVKYEVPNTTGNLNATYSNGASGVGATLTNAGTLVAFAPDGPTASQFDRVLIYNQTNAFENGVYEVTTVGSGSVAWVLTRTTDADSYGLKDTNALGNGDAFFVTSGNTGAGETYVCNTTGVITFGTTAITFAQISDSKVYSAGTGLTLSGTQFSITPVGTASTYGSASQVPVLTTNASGQISSVTNTNIAIDANQVTSGTLLAVRGGTGQSSYAVGDLLYADSTTTLAKLADVATGNVLLSGGTNTAPSYGKVGLGTHISGVLAVSNGGTGLSTLTANGVLYASTTSAFSQSANLTFNGTTLTTGGLSDSGNLTFTGTGNRITGDFNNGTLTSRVYFQNSNSNVATSLGALPNGTGTSSQFIFYNNSDPTNAGRFRIQASSTAAEIISDVSGTGTYLPLTMYTGGSERLRIDTSGNVGIGTISPGGKLEVYSGASGATAFSNGANLIIQNSGAVGMSLLSPDANAARIYFGTASNNRNAFIYSDYNSGSQTLLFGVGTSTTAATEKMRIDSSGNVGIGTTSPAYRFQAVENGNLNATSSISNTTAGTSSLARFLAISDAGSAAFGFTSSSYTDITGAQDALLLNTSNASGGMAFCLDGTVKMKMDSSGNVGIGNLIPGNFVAAGRPLVVGSGVGNQGITIYSSTTDYGGLHFADGTAGTDSYRGVVYYQHSTDNMQFWTAAQERMRITSGGDVGIGTGSPSTKLTVVGAMNFGANVSAPAVDAGIFRPSDGTLAFVANVQERMRITSSGDVLVGVTSAAYSFTNRGNITIGGSISGILGFRINGANSGYIYHSGVDLEVWNQANGPTIFGTNNTERMRITSTGAVSFGFTGTAYGVQNAALISNGDTTPTWNQVASLGSFFYQTAFMGGF